MKLTRTFLPGFMGQFKPGEQLILSAEMAEPLMNDPAYEVTKVKIFLNQSPQYKDDSETAYKVKVLGTVPYSWAVRVVHWVRWYGKDTTLIVTQGAATKKALATGARSTMVKQPEVPTSVEQDAIIIYDYELDEMYHGFLLRYNTNEPLIRITK